MDMTRYLHRKLTNDELKTRDGWRYEGRILRVEEQRVFNKYKFTKEEIVPMISFEDGWEWIPNIGARNALTEALGADTDRWIGRRLRVYLKAVTRTEKISGRAKEQWEKQVEVLDDVEGV
jgi:hypothetical protein